MPVTLVDKLRRKQADAAAEYDQLVRRAAGGEDIDPDEAAAVLAAADKSADELAADIAKRTRRLDLRAVLDDADTRKRTLAAAEAAVAKVANDRVVAERKLAAERQRVLAELDLKAAEAQSRRDEAAADVDAVSAARKELTATAPAELVDAAESAASRSSFAFRQLRELEPRIARLEANAGSPTFVGGRELDRLRAEVARLRAAAEAADAEAAELNRRKLDP